MTSARLLAWERLERRRSGDGRREWIVAAVVGLVLAGAFVALRERGAGEAARGWWRFALCVAGAAVVMRGPWRLFWRPDAVLLARLPIDGAALYRLGLWRSARAALLMGVTMVIAAAPWFGGFDDGPAVAARFAGLTAVTMACAALLAPAATAAGGAIVASDRAQAAIDAMAGEFHGPSVMWLSVIPTLGGIVVAAVPYLLGPWLASGETATEVGDAAVVVATVGVASLVAVLAAAPLARATLSAATREVAALDAVKLAHVEKDGARGLEAVWARLAGPTGSPGAAVYRKDVALARRRFPAFYLLTGAGIIVLWGVTIFGGDATRTSWCVGITAGMAAYLAIFGRRLATPPIERPRLLRTLPISPTAAARAKGAYLAWRTLMPFTLAATPAIVRAADPARLGITIATIALAGLILGTVLSFFHLRPNH